MSPERCRTWHLDMFQLWAWVLRDAGYPERALGLYQAMIDIHLSISNDNKADFSQRLATLERTWDTNKLR